MNSVITTLGALGLGLGLAVAAADRLAFERPPAGALRVTVDARHDLDLVTTTTRSGEGDPVTQSGNLALVTTRSVSVIDARRAAGRPGLRRVYGEVVGNVRIGQRSEDGAVEGVDVPMKGLLGGASVAFVPAEIHPDGFARHYDSVEAARERHLPGLAPPTDWAPLAPPASGPTGLEVGDTWSIPAGALGALVAPLGDLQLREPGAEPMIDENLMRTVRAGAGADLHFAFRGEVEGGARAEVVAVEDGVVEIALRFEVTSAADVTSILGDGHTAPEGMPDSALQAAEAQLMLTGTGEVRWAPDLARPLEAVVRGDQAIRITAQTIDIEAIVTVQTLEFSGPFEVRTRVEPAEAPPAAERG